MFGMCVVKKKLLVGELSDLDFMENSNEVYKKLKFGFYLF